MELKIWESCYSRGYKLDNVSNEELSKAKKIQLIRKMLINATTEQLDYLIQDYGQELCKSINYDSDICDQCGNWNYTNTLEI